MQVPRVAAIRKDARAAKAPSFGAITIELVAGTPVLTLEGILPVEHLLAQDRLVTRSGAMTITAIDARSLRHPDLMCVSARALGHDRPEADILLPADQPVVLRDWRARAMFGAPEATVTLRRLVDGTHIRPAPPADVRIVRLTLPRAAVIYAGGLELASQPVPVAA